MIETRNWYLEYFKLTKVIYIFTQYTSSTNSVILHNQIDGLLTRKVRENGVITPLCSLCCERKII